jgi:type I restriction enzyme, R subunit
MAQVKKHGGCDPEAKTIEREQAIRKYCTVHFNEDPAFYKKMSEKLENSCQWRSRRLPHALRADGFVPRL